MPGATAGMACGASAATGAGTLPMARAPGVCACCFVWEVTRGPHAGERVVFTSATANATANAMASATATLAIGRKASSWLRLRKDLEVSGCHAELRVTRGSDPVRLTLSDADSTNGTRVNGVALARGEVRAVGDQDLLQFGRSTVRVRMGDTQCPRARHADDATEPTGHDGPDTTTTSDWVPPPPSSEPEREPMAIQDPPDETVDHSDENAFEAPPPVEVCMVCGQALAAWSVLEQQLHVNACLDRRAGAVATQRSTVAAGATVSVPPVGQGKKRKRQATLAKRRADEELAVALALSESLADPEQKVDTEMALVRGELAQLDAQLKKLEKRRVALVKKLEKLEKTKRKVHKSQVRAPEETRALLDLEWALRVVFPAARQVHVDTTERKRRLRPTVARLLERYRPVDETDEETPYVAMWQRSSLPLRQAPEQAGEGKDGEGNNSNQDDDEEEDDPLYVNRLLRWLRTREKERPVISAAPVGLVQEVQAVRQEDIDMTTGEPINATDSPFERTTTDSDDFTTSTEPMVPEVVTRVFPNWRDNLAFLRTQSVPDLKDALEEMRKMQAGQKLEAAASEMADGEDGVDDEMAACAFFEDEMLRLIAQKESMVQENNVEVVVLIDSQDDRDPEADVGISMEEIEPRKGPPSVLSIDDSSDEDDKFGTNQSPEMESPRMDPSENHATDAVDPKAMEDVDPSEGMDFGVAPISPVSAESAPTATTAPPPEVLAQPRTRVAPSRESTDAQLDGQLLTALKANAQLYESVLLLQPLDLQQLLHYVRDDAGIKCPKTALVRFCDRHGITFKSS